MATKSNDALAVGALVFGLGMLVAGAFASDAPDRRARFHARLREALAENFVELVSAEVAAGEAGREWRVTMFLPDRQVLTLRAPLHAEVDALDDSTCDDVIARILRYLRALGAVR